MALMKLRQRQHEATTMRRVLHALFFCVFFASGLISCATEPVREKAQVTEPEKPQVAEPEKPQIVEPEKRAPEPGELAGKAANVTEFTKLVYAEETIEQTKTTRDRIKITVISQSPESARKEARSFYAAYCETRNGRLVTGLPVPRIPENLPAHIKPPYAQRFKKKYDLPPSVQWCQDKEDVYFGVEMRDRTEGVNGPGLTVTVYTESFVEKNRVWTSHKDMISKIEKEIEKDKQDILYSLGIIDLPTIMLTAKVPRPDAEGNQHLELRIENRGKTIIQIRTDSGKKFVARDGKSHDILWEQNKDGEPIMATSPGEGCQLTNKNTLFIVDPGSKCSLFAPIRLPGVSQHPPDGMITLGLFTFDMHRVSAYEDKTSPLVRSHQ
jgi:hypothetical protein